MSQMYRVECIDQEHARNVELELSHAGWGTALLGKSVITDCQEQQLLSAVVLTGVAVVGEADYSDVLFYAENKI